MIGSFCHRATLPLCVLFIVACGGSGTSGAVTKPATRDSAGVAIVQNTTPVWHDGAGWTLTEKPTVAIGVLDGAPEYQFFQVSGTLRLTNGTIVVANAGSNQLRFYDASGKFVRSTGRQGSGPGEFKQMGSLYRFPADTVGVFDYSLQRMSLFTSDGNYVRSFALRAPGGGGFLAPVAPFSDGTLLAISYAFSRGMPKSGVQRDSTTYVRADQSGAVLDTIGRFVGDQTLVVSGDNFMTMMQLAFGRQSFIAVHDTMLVFGANDTYQFERLNWTGHVTQIVRNAHTAVPVTSEDRSAYSDKQLAGASTDNEKRFQRTILDKTPWPETFPAYDDLVVDADGDVWVKRYAAPADSTNVWTVFDTTGWKLGSVSFPYGYSVKQIGTDFVLGIWKDANDVEHVLEFGISKPEARLKADG